MRAYIFPGQGSQYVGMAKELYEQHALLRELFERANELLDFKIIDVMFNGPEERLKQTVMTQPAIFLHSIALVELDHDFKPDFVAGHSLGEFSALVAAKAFGFEAGLKLVQARAQAMQEACDCVQSTMAAVIGLDDEKVKEICSEINEVYPANFNCPGQVAIAGSEAGVLAAEQKMKSAGARMVVPLKVAGAFHSSFMEPARMKLEKAINEVEIQIPICPVYQNADASPHIEPHLIRENLIKQLTAPVLWTQTIKNMERDGATEFIEMGPGKVLTGLVKKIRG